MNHCETCLHWDAANWGCKQAGVRVAERDPGYSEGRRAVAYRLNRGKARVCVAVGPLFGCVWWEAVLPSVLPREKS